MINVGNILSTVGVFSTMGGYHEYCGGYLEYRRDVQYRGGYHDARGAYHEYRGGCSVLWGENLLLFEYPTVLNTLTVLMMSPHMYHDIPHMCHDIPHGTHISKDGIPHGNEHPPRYS